MNTFGNNLREGVLKFQLDNSVVQNITITVDEQDIAHWEGLSGNGDVLCSGAFDLNGTNGQLQEILLTEVEGIPVLNFVFSNKRVYCDLTSLYNLIDTKQDNLTAGRFISITEDNIISNTMSRISELENDVGYYNEIHWEDVLDRPEINSEIPYLANKVPLNNIELDDVYYFVDLSSVVPYEGATMDVDLNNKSISNINNLVINGTIFSTVSDSPINNIVTTNSDQIINAVKTFNKAPKASYTPSFAEDLAPKSYVDLHLTKADYGKSLTVDIYSNTKTYKEDDIVYYNNSLYKALVNIDTPEEFNVSKWFKVTITELINEKQDILVSGHNIKTIAGKSILGEGDFTLTKDVVGLGNVDNTSDLDKPVSTATQKAIDIVRDYLNTHKADFNNPHKVTKKQLELENVTNDAQVKRTEMGAPSGVATLGNDGKIPLEQFPDAILGQLVYGGTFGANNVANLSSNAKYKLQTEENTITLVNSADTIGGWLANEGIYYLSSDKNNFAGLDFNTNDILIATATKWVKIDNTDFVKSVAGKVGVVTLSITDITDLPSKLEEIDNSISSGVAGTNEKIEAVDAKLEEHITASTKSFEETNEKIDGYITSNDAVLKNVSNKLDSTSAELNEKIADLDSKKANNGHKHVAADTTDFVDKTNEIINSNTTICFFKDLGPL